MDKTVPAGAAMLLDFIYRTETSKAPPECYGVIYGDRQYALAKPLTAMTLGDVIDAQKVWSAAAWANRFGSTKASSAAGAAQFMRATLIDLAKELRLLGKQLFDADLQDRLAFHLLKRRGYDAFMAGKISRTEFGKRLAQEWASLPVLAACQGAHRPVPRGSSFYMGDKLNKSLVAPERVEAVLEQVKAAGSLASTPERAEPSAAPAAASISPARPASGFLATFLSIFLGLFRKGA